MQNLTADMLLAAYSNGYFPMADSRNAEELKWYSPEKRGILPLDTFHIPKSLHKFMQKSEYEIRFNTAFKDVITKCANTVTKTRHDTWINDTIITLYCELAEKNYAQSVECWHQDVLVGGLYGVSIGKAFFGESMFSEKTNASKIALVHLVKRLRLLGYILLDTQYTNDHLQQFGVVEIDKADYQLLLEKATL